MPKNILAIGYAVLISWHALAGEKAREQLAGDTKAVDYSCRCVKTSDKSPPQGQDCNFPGFSILLSPRNAVISGYFGGTPHPSKKSKNGTTTYVGFDGLDFHFQVELEVEPEKKAQARKMKLHASGEKNISEQFLCKADRSKVHH